MLRNHRPFASPRTYTSRRVPLATCAFLASIALGCGGGGGTSSIKAPAAGEIIALTPKPRVDQPGRISVFFQVVAQNGNPIADLTEADFHLAEDGNPVSISESQLQLRPKPQVFRPYSMLLLDRSGSVVQSAEGRQREIDSAKAYIELVTEAPEAFVAVSWFDGQQGIHTLVDFSNDRDELLDALGHLHDEPPLNPSTNLYGAVVAGLDALDVADQIAIDEGVEFRSLSLVIFTDGSDQAGTTPLAAALAALTRQVDGRDKYNAFTIGLGAEIDQGILQQLGPGGATFAEAFDDLGPHFEDTAGLVRDLANSFYLLSYCSPKQDGSGLHDLSVSVDFGGATATRNYTFNADYFGSGCGFLDTSSGFLPTEDIGLSGARDMVEDAAQGILITGTYGADSEEAYVMRLKRNGKLDRSFGIEGWRRLNNWSGNNRLHANAIVVDADGNIYLGGSAGYGDSPALAVIFQLDAQGQLLAGWTSPLLSSDGDEILGLAIDNQGRLVAAGRAGVAEPWTAVWRVNPDLTSDTTFNAIGHLLHANEPTTARDKASALAIAADDSIVLVGQGWIPNDGGSIDLKVMRLSADGTLDPDFNAGQALGNLGVFQSNATGKGYDVSIDSLGRIVVAGYLSMASEQEIAAVWRLTATGAADTSFFGSPSSHYPGTGLVTLRTRQMDNERIDFGLDCRLKSIFVHTDDSILVAGWRLNAQGHTDLAIMRFTEAGLSHGDYNAVGFLIDDGAGGDDSGDTGETLLIHTDGRILCAGATQPAQDPERRDLSVWIDADPNRVFAPTGMH